MTPPPTPPSFQQIFTFWDPLNPKMKFANMCLSVSMSGLYARQLFKELSGLDCVWAHFLRSKIIFSNWKIPFSGQTMQTTKKCWKIELLVLKKFTHCILNIFWLDKYSSRLNHVSKWAYELSKLSLFNLNK